MHEIDPTETLQDTTRLAALGDRSAVDWLLIMTPDLADDLGLNRDLTIAEELDNYIETIAEQAMPYPG